MTAEMRRFLVMLLLIKLTNATFFWEDPNQKSSIFLKMLGVPVLDCKGSECFYQLLEARPTVRLRIVVNQIIDRIRGRFVERENFKDRIFRRKLYAANQILINRRRRKLQQLETIKTRTKVSDERFKLWAEKAILLHEKHSKGRQSVDNSTAADDKNDSSM